MFRSSIVLTTLFTLSSAFANDSSVLSAVKVAQKEVRADSQKLLIQIEGEPNAPGVLPVEWKLWFYDPYAEQDGVMIRVAGDTLVEMKDGYTEMDRFRLAAYKLNEAFDPAVIKTDAPQVLSTLEKAPALQGIKITSLDLRLRKDGKTPHAPVIWTVKIFAQKPLTEEEVRLGQATISASTGNILDLKVDPKKLE